MGRSKSEDKPVTRDVPDPRRRLKILALQGRLFHRRRLFVDCGSNLGQGYEYFRKFLVPEWYDAILIEPNPNCMRVLKETYGHLPHIRCIEAAVWKEETTLRLFGLVEDHRGEASEGASVVPEHNNSMYESNRERALSVKAISLSRLLHEEAKTYSQIVVKLDVESAEYEVLADLFSTGIPAQVRHFFVEFHSRYFKEPDQGHYRALEESFVSEFRRRRIGFTPWH